MRLTFWSFMTGLLFAAGVIAANPSPSFAQGYGGTTSYLSIGGGFVVTAAELDAGEKVSIVVLVSKET